MNELTRCPFCREEIKSGAIKCKHCRSLLASLDDTELGKPVVERESLWLPLPSLLLAIVSVAVFPTSLFSSADDYLAVLAAAISAIVLGIVSIVKQRMGKVMAIVGIVIGVFSLFAVFGALG